MLNAVGQAQNILLLGGTSEIGLAIVSELASRGGNPTVTLAARKGSSRIDAAVQEVSAAGPPRCASSTSTPPTSTPTPA